MAWKSASFIASFVVPGVLSNEHVWHTAQNFPRCFFAPALGFRELGARAALRNGMVEGHQGEDFAAERIKCQ